MFIRRLTPGELTPDALIYFNRDQSVAAMYTQNVQVSAPSGLSDFTLAPAHGTYTWSKEEKEIVTGYLNCKERISFLAEVEPEDATAAVNDYRKILGFASLRKVQSVSGDPWLLDLLYVDADHRRQGIGRRLFDAVLDAARETSAVPLLITADPSEEAVRFYLKAGAEFVKNAPSELTLEEPGNLILQISLS